MTGYGRAIKKDKNFTLTVEIRSLNSKYFDIISRVDDSIIMYENEIIKLIKNKCERGKFFLNINISNNYTEKNKNGSTPLGNCKKLIINALDEIKKIC